MWRERGGVEGFTLLILSGITSCDGAATSEREARNWLQSALNRTEQRVKEGVLFSPK